MMKRLRKRKTKKGLSGFAQLSFSLILVFLILMIAEFSLRWYLALEMVGHMDNAVLSGAATSQIYSDGSVDFSIEEAEREVNYILAHAYRLELNDDYTIDFENSENPRLTSEPTITSYYIAPGESIPEELSDVNIRDSEHGVYIVHADLEHRRPLLNRYAHMSLNRTSAAEIRVLTDDLQIIED